MKSWNRPRATLPAVMTLTVKSTKAPGSVSHKNLHCAPAAKTEGHNEWINFRLNKHINAHEHVVSSTEDFIKKIHLLEVKPSDVMIRIDLDSYFMSGSPTSLSAAASLHLAGDEVRPVLDNAIFWVTKNQWVTAPHNKQQYRVLSGSGMGLRLSASVCDAALLNLAEAGYALSPSVRRAYGIKAYFRFRDDIWILSESHAEFPDWYRGVKRLATPIFFMKVVEISSFAVTMLAVKVIKQPHGFDVRPRDRTYEDPPLSMYSGHHPSVTLSWPRSAARMICRFSSERSRNSSTSSVDSTTQNGESPTSPTCVACLGPLAPGPPAMSRGWSCRGTLHGRTSG